MCRNGSVLHGDADWVLARLLSIPHLDDNACLDVQPTAVDPAEEAAAEPEGEDIIQATPAELPDHAYIRTQATGTVHQLRMYAHASCHLSPRAS